MIFRVVTELFLLTFLIVWFKSLIPGWLFPFLIAGFVAHTAFWIFDSTLPAALQFASPNAVNPGAEATMTYLNQMAVRLGRHRSVSGIVIFGSVARRQWHRRSDLDLRLLRRPGIWNLLAANLLLSRERTIALWNGQPLDVYLVDDIDGLLNMRSDEQPIFTLKRDLRLERTWPDRPERMLSLADFRSNS